MTQPSDKALVPFVSVDNMMRLIHTIGIDTVLIGESLMRKSDVAAATATLLGLSLPSLVK